MGIKNDNKKITLWTSQRKIVLNTLEEKGVYHVKRDFIVKKYGEVSNVFLEPYNWFVNKAKEVVAKPEGAEYPIWLFTDLKYVDNHGDSEILEISVDKDKAILFDHIKWNRILNLSYVAKDEKDAKEYEEMLEKQGIYDETDIYMTSFYPHLKMKVKNSWNRLFDCDPSTVKQAALWEIRKEWIVNL